MWAGQEVRHIMGEGRTTGGEREATGSAEGVSGGNHMPPAPDFAASQAPTYVGVVGMISEIWVGRAVTSDASSQKSSI